MEHNERKVIAQKIRDEYTEKAPDRLDELVALDKMVKRPAKVLAYTVGTVGSLVLGSGMCLAMGVIGKRKLPGILIGTAGIAMLAGNYPMYKAHLKSRKAEYADRILSLSEEISEGYVFDDTEGSW